MSAVSFAASLKPLYMWLNKQCSYFHPVKQGALVMMVLPLVCSLVLCPRVRQTHPACDILNLSCKAAFKKKNNKQKTSKNTVGLFVCQRFSTCSTLCLQRKEGRLFFQLIVWKPEDFSPFSSILAVACNNSFDEWSWIHQWLCRRYMQTLNYIFGKTVGTVNLLWLHVWWE